MSSSSSLKDPGSSQDTGNYLKGLGWVIRGSSDCLTVLWVSWHLHSWNLNCVNYTCRWNFSSNYAKNLFLFSPCPFAFTIKTISLWMEILCAANFWTLKQVSPPLSVFRTLSSVVVSPLLVPFCSFFYEGSVLTLQNWDCKIRMTMCEMETSVYHFAISTLQCSFLAAIRSLSYTFISWFAFIFIFFINSVLECFLKAARSAELPFPHLCLEHKCSRSQKRWTKEDIKMGLRITGRAFALCWQRLVFCTKEPTHSLSVGTNGNSGGSRTKCVTTWGSSHNPTPQHRLVTEAETAACP